MNNIDENINFEELIILKLDNNLTSENEKLFNLLYTSNSHFAEEYKKTEKLWNNIEEALFYESIDENKAINKIIEYSKKKNKTKSIFISPTIRTTISIAAIFIIILTISLYIYFPKETTTNKIASGNIKKELNLPDGSEIKLNKKTEIEYFANNNKVRIVKLAGEAYFKVKSDKKRPFIIKCSQMEVEVVGTSFNILAEKNCDSAIVSVTSGKVKVSLNNKFNYLSDGQQAIVYSSTNSIILKNNSITNNISWKTGILEFNETPLNEAIISINKIYETDIRIKNKNLSNFKITATLDNQPIESVLEMLKLSFHLQITGDTIKWIDSEDI